MTAGIHGCLKLKTLGQYYCHGYGEMMSVHSFPNKDLIYMTGLAEKECHVFVFCMQVYMDG